MYEESPWEAGKWAAFPNLTDISTSPLHRGEASHLPTLLRIPNLAQISIKSQLCAGPWTGT